MVLDDLALPSASALVDPTPTFAPQHPFTSYVVFDLQHPVLTVLYVTLLPDETAVPPVLVAILAAAFLALLMRFAAGVSLPLDCSNRASIGDIAPGLHFNPALYAVVESNATPQAYPTARNIDALGFIGLFGSKHLTNAFQLLMAFKEQNRKFIPNSHNDQLKREDKRKQHEPYEPERENQRY